MSPEIPDSGSDKRSGRRRGKKTDRKADLGAWGFAAFLLAVSLAAIIVGIHDAALGGAGLGVNALGAILAVVGAVLLVSAVLLFQLGRRSTWQGGSRPRCKPVVLVGFLLVILIGSYVALSSLRTASAQQPVVVAVALVLIGVAAGGLLTFRKETELNVPRLGAVALGLVGTLFAAWQFWYQNQYAPTRAGRAVALKVNLSRLGQKGDNDVIRADLDYEDIGGRSVSVLGSAYTLTGSRVIGCLRPSTVGRVRGIFDHPIPDPQRSFMTNAREERPGAVLAAGKFIGDGKRLDPNVAFRRSYVFFVPHGRYQLLRLRAELFAISASVPGPADRTEVSASSRRPRVVRTLARGGRQLAP